MILTYPVAQYGRFATIGSYASTFTCYDSKGKRRQAYLAAFLPELGNDVPVPTVQSSEISEFGKPAETDDVVQHMYNENAVEHQKLEGHITVYPRTDFETLKDYGWKSYDKYALIEFYVYTKRVTVPCSLLFTSNNTYALVPLQTWEDEYKGRKIHVRFGTTLCSNSSVTCAVFYWMTHYGYEPQMRVMGHMPYYANPTEGEMVKEATWSLTSPLSDYEHPDIDELDWKSHTYRVTVRSLCHLKSGVNGQSEPEHAKALIRMVQDDCVNALELRHLDLDVWGNLANTCTSKAKATSSNVLSTSYETVRVCQGVTDLLKGVAELKTAKPKRFLKAVGNLRLAWKWGVPLTVKDAREIANGVTDYVIEQKLYTNPDRKHVEHAHLRQDYYLKEAFSDYQGLSGVCDYWLKILYKENSTAKQQKAAKLAADLNLVTLENGWDVVPYSFVIDWMTDFGSILNQTDNVMYRVSYWDIVGHVRGTKRRYEIGPEAIARYDSAYSGSATWTIYLRRVFPDTIPLPTLGYLNPSIGVTQWLDGATLISQICD